MPGEFNRDTGHTAHMPGVSSSKLRGGGGGG
eukprot:COSAG03_NODE_23624_length_278_cov_1.000000_1_plen_30_part_01